MKARGHIDGYTGGYASSGMEVITLTVRCLEVRGLNEEGAFGEVQVHTGRCNASRSGELEDERDDLRRRLVAADERVARVTREMAVLRDQGLRNGDTLRTRIRELEAEIEVLRAGRPAPPSSPSLSTRWAALDVAKDDGGE